MLSFHHLDFTATTFHIILISPIYWTKESISRQIIFEVVAIDPPVASHLIFIFKIIISHLRTLFSCGRSSIIRGIEKVVAFFTLLLWFSILLMGLNCCFHNDIQYHHDSLLYSLIFYYQDPFDIRQNGLRWDQFSPILPDFQLFLLCSRLLVVALFSSPRMAISKQWSEFASTSLGALKSRNAMLPFLMVRSKSRAEPWSVLGWFQVCRLLLHFWKKE